MTVPLRLQRLALPVLLVLAVAACSGGAAVPSGEAFAPSDPTPGPTAPGARDPGGSGGGSGPGDPDEGAPVDPVPGPGDLGPETPRLVEPVPGARMVRDAAATDLRVALNGRRVAVQVAWWGGVEPCDVLAGVEVVRDGTTIALTVKAGAGPEAGPDVACIQVAVLKATIVDLGELAPGTWTVRAFGDAAPVEVVVS